jgi:hypothetical protein
MIKFKFKQTNYEVTPYYHPSAPGAGDSEDGTARPGPNVNATTHSD